MYRMHFGLCFFCDNLCMPNKFVLLVIQFHIDEVTSTYVQFMNKVLYAREGAKSIMDRTFADFPWQVRVEVDGVEIEVPEVLMLAFI